jgi:DNA-binding beta-propeller fold protein YncE
LVATLTLGAGRFQYGVEVNWESLPPGYSWREATSVAVDSQDRVYVFNRGDHPMMVFDSDGEFLRSWGEGIFTRPHGVALGPGDTLYCIDDGDHTVRQLTFEGEVLTTIGEPGKPAEYMSGAPFHRCTDVALDPKTGEIYVSDGYGNARVHKYSPDGKLLFSWGEPGTDPGEFNIVHNIATDKDGYVYVADRENHRIQVFDSNGRFETQWVSMHRPCTIYISQDQLVYVGELGSAMKVNRDMPNIGPRISVYNTSGDLLARLGRGYGPEAGQFIAPHGICTDSTGSIYVAEVSHTHITNVGEVPGDAPSLQKLIPAS